MFSKNGIPLFTGSNIDACRESQNIGPQAKAMLKMFGIPDSCPVAAVSDFDFVMLANSF
jgi:hypothetical protein